MGELDLAAVSAANDAWVWTPEGSEVVETSEYRLARLPDRYPYRAQVQWVRSVRPAATVLEDIVARVTEFGQPQAWVYAKLSAPEGFNEALLERGAQLVDTADLLARALPADATAPDVRGLDLRWRITPEIARDASIIGISAFGGDVASDDELAGQAAADRATVPAGAGGAIVAYIDGSAAAVAGIEIVDGVARLWGGAVLEAYRGRGVYRALVATRMAYAAEHGATMSFTHGRIATSSPILQRLGFVSYGQERAYVLPLG